MIVTNKIKDAKGNPLVKKQPHDFLFRSRDMALLSAWMDATGHWTTILVYSLSMLIFNHAYLKFIKFNKGR